jgi:hypothetical protein
MAGTARQQARFVVVRDGRGWRVQDTRTGVLHTARLGDKDKAQRAADRLNARLDRRQ